MNRRKTLSDNIENQLYKLFENMSDKQINLRSEAARKNIVDNIMKILDPDPSTSSSDISTSKDIKDGKDFKYIKNVFKFKNKAFMENIDWREDRRRETTL